MTCIKQWKWWKMNKYFKYIDDKIFYKIVKKVFSKYMEEINKTYDHKKNMLDPFHSAFIIAINNENIDDFKNSLKNPANAKTLSGYIGFMHEEMMSNIIGKTAAFIPEDETSIPEGTTSPDFKSINKDYVVEIKNKYNTIKGSNKIVVWKTLKYHVENNGYKKGIYLVVNEKKSIQEIWDFTHKKEHLCNNKIWKFSIDKFLIWVTKDKEAFNAYIQGFLDCLDDIIKNSQIDDMHKETKDELREQIFNESYENYE